MHCPTCGSSHDDAARYCGQCGAKLPERCKGCGGVMAPDQRFCTHCGRPTDAASPPPAVAPSASATDPDAEGERRHATIVFSDLSGYTALNERVDPEDVSLLMGELRELATRVVESHGGVINQFVGDEIMALFGVPQAGRDDAVRALRAALELHRAVRELAERHAARLGVRVDLHTGINSGMVVVRPCAPHQGRHALTGDAVNVAARLLKLAEPGDIVVGEDLWRMVSSQFEAERLPPAPVRGKSIAVQPWRVVREIEMAPAAPLIGRAEELRHARSALQSCIEAQAARWVIVRGEPGIGKSRLLQEIRTLALAAGAEHVAAAVPDFGPARGEVALRALIHGLLQGPAAADPASFEAQLSAAGLAERQRAHVCALLGREMAPAARAAYAALDNATRERGHAQALATLLRGRAVAPALVVALEDLHWAEGPVLTLLARVAAGCADRPVLFVLTTRPQSEAFEAARRAHAPAIPALTLDLGPLPEQAASDMAEHLSRGDPELARRCVARAGGNPLFLEQLLRSAGEALRDALPGSIQALVLARLDRLAPVDKTAVQAASVLGQRFVLEAWQALVESPRLEPLIDAGLLRPEDDAAVFVHALIRDGAYASLLKTRRRELHARAAAWYASRDLGLHAEHLALAESPLAADAFAQAARAEALRFRYAEALAYAERGSRCAEAPAERHALAMLKGEMLRELGRNTEALDAFTAARDAATDEAGAALASYEQATVLRLLSQVDAAWQALDRAEPVAEQLGATRWLSGIHYVRGNLCFARGDHAGCAAHHEQALRLALQCGDALAEAQALSGLGDAHYAAGRMRSALDAFERCVAACERSGALRFAVMNRAMLGWCCYWHGRADDCRRHLQTAGAAAVALSHRNAEAMVTESLGLMLNWMGDPEARATLERAAQLSHEVGMKRFEMVSRAGLANALRRAGETGQALAMARHAWRLCVEVGGEAFAGPLVLIEIAANTPDRDEAEAMLQRAEALLAQGAVAHNHFFGYPDLMRLRLAQGRHDEVLRLADRLEAFGREEPTLWVAHHAAAARALVTARRAIDTPDALPDERRAGLRTDIAGLAAEARGAGLLQSADALEDALRRLA
jgi:class 3 adenylate cyclase/tetratricopeptide (TPR) repeat protein